MILYKLELAASYRLSRQCSSTFIKSSSGALSARVTFDQAASTIVADDIGTGRSLARFAAISLGALAVELGSIQRVDKDMTYSVVNTRRLGTWCHFAARPIVALVAFTLECRSRYSAFRRVFTVIVYTGINFIQGSQFNFN